MDFVKRTCPFNIKSTEGDKSSLTIQFSKEVTAVCFFHFCKDIQDFCESGKRDGTDIKKVLFDLKQVNWFDTLALGYLLMFAWRAKHQARIKCYFEISENPAFQSFLWDNGFLKYMLAETKQTEYISRVPYSKIHKCFFPFRIILRESEIEDILNEVKNQMVNSFSSTTNAEELDHSINKVMYFLQETLENVYKHAYRKKTDDPNPCMVLIKHVNAKGIDDVDKYEKNYISNTPYIHSDLFESKESYLEIYVADIGIGIRKSFLQDPDGKDAGISDANIIDYILSEGKRSNRIMSSSQDTKYGGLYDIFNLFHEEQDSLGLKSDSSWFYDKQENGRINTEEYYGSYCRLMHGFALVGAIQIKRPVIESYPLENVLKDRMKKWKNTLFTEVLRKEVLDKVKRKDYRLNLNLKQPESAEITAIYPERFFSKAQIVNSILMDKNETIYIAGIQEREQRKYQSIVERLSSNRFKGIHRIILVTDTLYVYVYTLLDDTFTLSWRDTKKHILNDKCDRISESYLAYLRFERYYNSLCIWRLLKQVNSKVYLNKTVYWNDTLPLNGYLDFSQLMLEPVCRDFCIRRLLALHSLENDIYFKSIDRFTEEICEQANYQLGNSPNSLPIFIGSVYVSGSSSRIESSDNDIFYFFKHEHSIDDNALFMFTWATNKKFIDEAFPSTLYAKTDYRRVGVSPFVASGGAYFWADNHYKNHNSEYLLRQSELYTVLQRRIGVHPATFHIGHFDCLNHHDLFGIRMNSLFNADMMLHQFLHRYENDSCFDFLVTEIIYGLCGKCVKRDLKQEVLNPNIAKGKLDAVIQKCIDGLGKPRKKKMGFIVYLYDFQTAEIMEKITDLLSEEYRQRIIPIIPVDREYTESSLLVSPLLLERLQDVIQRLNRINVERFNTKDVNATLFISTAFSLRVRDEIQLILENLGVSSVSTLTLLDRQRVVLKSDLSRNSKSYGRIDLPSLGTHTACPVCNGRYQLAVMLNDLISIDIRDRLNEILKCWEKIKESDNYYGKGIKAEEIILSNETKGFISEIGMHYNQGEYSIWTNAALATFAEEYSTITSSSEFITRCLNLDVLAVNSKGEPDLETSGKLKILLVCVYLLSSGTSKTSDKLIVNYIETLYVLIETQPYVSEYTGLAVITISSLPDAFKKRMFKFLSKRTNKQYLNYDALLVHLTIYYWLHNRENDIANQDYESMIRCYFKSGKAKLDLLYDMFLYSEREYEQSHVQALAQIAASDNLDLYTYKKGLQYVEKILEIVQAKDYEQLFHEPNVFCSARDCLILQLETLKEELSGFDNLTSVEQKQKVMCLVKKLTDTLHDINSSSVYLRVPANEKDKYAVMKWLDYCKDNAYQRLPKCYHHEDIIISLPMDANVYSNPRLIKERPWFYTFKDVTEEIINIYVDMLKGASGELIDNGITSSEKRGRSCLGIIKFSFKEYYAELTFYNATDTEKSIESIRKIKASKHSRSSLMVFREFDQKFKHIGIEAKALNWDYVQNTFKKCVVDTEMKIFSATVKIPYIDMGSSMYDL